MVEKSWDALEQPILEAVAELEDSDSFLGPQAVADRTGIPLDQVRNGVRRLLDTDLLTGRDGGGLASLDPEGLRLLPRGRQVVGQWPSSDPAEAFLELLDERITVEDDPEERDNIEKARDSVGQVGKNVLTGVITALVKQVTGLG